MNPVVHFEMPYDDSQRAARFYSAAFGWNMQALGAAMNDYVLATTTPSEQGRPTAPGTINGGLFPRKPDWPGQHPSVVIAVDDMASAMDRVRRAGGTVYGEPMMIPGVGEYVAFSDTEGNRLCMLKPLAMNANSNGGDSA